MLKTEVSGINRCQSDDADRLCIYDIVVKLKSPGQYDIGGTYTFEESDLWFFYETSVCPGYNYLINLFVLHRKATPVSIGVSNGNLLTHSKSAKEVIGYSTFPKTLYWQSFGIKQEYDISFIKTFCLGQKDLANIKNNILHIPITILINPRRLITEDIKCRIKLKHDFGEKLFKDEKTDFVLETPSGKKFKMHKIVLAAHSPVLRDLLKDIKEKSMFIDISDRDIELLIEFVYTGNIKDISQHNCLQLLETAHRFQLKNLLILTQYAITKQMTVANAIEIAMLSEKYKIKELQAKIFSFIKKNPQVLHSDGWKNLNDLNLTKKLLEYIYKDTK